MGNCCAADDEDGLANKPGILKYNPLRQLRSGYSISNRDNLIKLLASKPLRTHNHVLDMWLRMKPLTIDNLEAWWDHLQVDVPLVHGD